MDKLSRRPNETELEYHKRLVYGKLVDGTLADEDYSELAPYVYGKEYSTDVARRMMYGSCRTLKLLDSQNRERIVNKDVLTELEEKKIELQKEGQKFRDQRREFNKLVSASGRQENLYKSLIEAANNLTDSVGNLMIGHNNDMPPCSNNEAVLVFSDWHYGMETNGVFNTFNKEICKQRIVRIVLEAESRIRLHQCSKLHIVILGDLFHGAIHTSARVASEELVCEQLMQISEILAQSILYLSRCVTQTIVHTTYGNHARTVQNKNDSIHRDNMERLVPWWLTQRIAAEKGDENNSIVILPESENEFIIMQACGHDICASHGDLDNVRTSPRLLTLLLNKKYKKNIEYIILGDKHHRESFDELGVTATVCGSLCGTDEYANNKRLFSLPSQLLLIVNPEIGVDAEYHLKCD